MADEQSCSAINGDMQQRVVIDTARVNWRHAPHGSVWRKRLHLVGPQEAGQVTSIVRYEPNSEFPEHGHPDGEEIFVLEGTFCDENRASAAGTYLLHPEGFRHSPYSPNGCLLFVKLRQYAGKDRRYVTLDTLKMQWQPTGETGIEVKMLYADPGFADRTRLERWATGASLVRRAYPGGAEILVLRGVLVDEVGEYPAGSWLRLPEGAEHAPRSEKGCEIYVKTNALAALATTAE